MPVRYKPVTGEVYHIYNRGVEKRDVFLNDDDRSRFLSALIVFNDTELNLSAYRFLSSDVLGVGLPTRAQNPLVEIMAFCLMPNHYHLMLKAVVENGITSFMQRLGTSYTNYFNLKYSRVGPLFQGKYKAIAITNQSHLLYLPHYIHSNPLDIIVGSRTPNTTTMGDGETLKEYPWSSLGDYLGGETFDQILQKNFINDIFNDYQQDFYNWLPSREEQLVTLREQKIIFD